MINIKGRISQNEEIYKWLGDPWKLYVYLWSDLIKIVEINFTFQSFLLLSFRGFLVLAYISNKAIFRAFLVLIQILDFHKLKFTLRKLQKNFIFLLTCTLKHCKSLFLDVELFGESIKKWLKNVGLGKITGNRDFFGKVIRPQICIFIGLIWC